MCSQPFVDCFPWVSFFKGRVTCISTSLVFIVKVFWLCGSSSFICEEAAFHTCNPFGSADRRPGPDLERPQSKRLFCGTVPSTVPPPWMLFWPLCQNHCSVVCVGVGWKAILEMSYVACILLDKVDRREKIERKQTGKTCPTLFPNVNVTWFPSELGCCCGY